MRVQPHLPSNPLTAIVTSSSGAAFLACKAANSPAPPAPRMRMSVSRLSITDGSRLDVLAAEATRILGEPGVGGVALRLSIGSELEILLPGPVGAEADAARDARDRLPVGPDLDEAGRAVEADAVEHRHPAPERVRQQ